MDKSFLKKLLFYLTVPKCVCCTEKLDIDDRALCKSCLSEYERTKDRQCSVCFKNLNECKCTNDYLDAHMVHKVVKLFRYKPSEDPNIRVAANELIYNVKRVARRDLIDLISDELSEAIKNSVDPSKYVITNVPRKPGRIVEYGIDHAAEIAKAVAKKLKIEYVRVLKSNAKFAQKKLRGEARLKNARFDYLKRADSVEGKRVLLLDDIITTGSSMGSAAMLIRGVGAKEVVGVCMAITYKDKYKPMVRIDYSS